ncbi:hypothetical protein PI125_g21607 [Phytophthora idaei]|nr:hypothetical protein PI125_g21607 [Phytophthora idaei]
MEAPIFQDPHVQEPHEEARLADSGPGKQLPPVYGVGEEIALPQEDIPPLANSMSSST